jgi:quinol monooxygenase YgiN
VLTVIALYKTRPDTADTVAAALAGHVAATREEPGCIQFVALRSRDEPSRFVLYEQYVDEDAFVAHRESRHFREYVDETIVPLLAERQFARYDEVMPRAD